MSVRQAVSFLELSKAKKLRLLGDMYEKLRQVGSKRVHLDLILHRNSVRACTSVGCVVGWAATDRSISDRLEIRLGGYDLAKGRFDISAGEDLSLNLTPLQPQFKHKDVHPVGPHVSCIHVFKEQRLSAFLFGGISGTESRIGHYRAALARLLYIGQLIDSNTNMSEWAKENFSTEADDFVHAHRQSMAKSQFVMGNLDRVLGKRRPKAKPQAAQ